MSSSEVSIGLRIRVIKLVSVQEWEVSTKYLETRREGAVGNISGFFSGKPKPWRVTHDDGSVAAYTSEELAHEDLGWE